MAKKPQSVPANMNPEKLLCALRELVRAQAALNHEREMFMRAAGAYASLTNRQRNAFDAYVDVKASRFAIEGRAPDNLDLNWALSLIGKEL